MSSGPLLYDCINDKLRDSNINPALLIEFNWETMCYVLHFLDRSLSDITSHSKRFELIESLLNTICSLECTRLQENGVDTTSNEVEETFRQMFNLRTLEYGKYGADWYQKVSHGFGRYAANALELPKDKVFEIALHIMSIGPVLYGNLHSYFVPIFETAFEEK